MDCGGLYGDDGGDGYGVDYYSDVGMGMCMGIVIVGEVSLFCVWVVGMFCLGCCFVLVFGSDWSGLIFCECSIVLMVVEGLINCEIGFELYLLEYMVCAYVLCVFVVFGVVFCFVVVVCIVELFFVLLFFFLW